jgi:hydrogenase maturation protein HypF
MAILPYQRDDESARLALHVRGIVQGVGFRPFVHRLAGQMALVGSVRNRGDGVLIEVEGPRHRLQGFVAEITHAAPERARVDAVTLVQELAATGGHGFQIEDSADSRAGDERWFAADAAVCDACLSEMASPDDRRFQYAFISCSDCGPRMTIVEDAPYDRARTTMAAFPPCERCRAEYLDPADRRFHAQTIACPACGPRLSLDGARDPIADAAARLCRGEVVAVKGLGGYHLACDATSEAAVNRLRARKHRDEKPFAVMVRHLDEARALAELDAAAARSCCAGRAALVGSPGRWRPGARRWGCCCPTRRCITCCWRRPGGRW